MLTLIVATYNGQRTLPGVFDAYTRLAEPPGGWKVILADNGSSDGTPKTAAEYAKRLPITLVTESRRGQNWARLKALEHIEGDLVVFSDDDATPDPDWLVQLRRAADTRSDYDLFTGAILPRWEVPPPAWVLRKAHPGVCFTLTDPKLVEGPVPPRFVFSPNMAFRRRVFDLGYQFDPSVGPSGASYPMGSETDFAQRLGEAGFNTWYCPAARVHHFIRKEQLDEQWLLGRAFRYGRGLAFKEARDAVSRGERLPGMRKWIVRRLAELHAARALAWMSGDQEAAFSANWGVQELRGYLFELAERKKAIGHAVAAEHR
jgi:glycosyltransferase involved in cell wall biosynthesis